MVTDFKNSHQMYAMDRPMALEQVENGIILPRIDAGDYPMWGLGGVCDKDNNFVDLCFYDGGWATHGGKYEWDNETFCDKTAVYFGYFFPHWGHFQVDQIGRLWYFAQAVKEEDVVLAYLGDEDPSGNFLQFLELAGVRADQLMRITEPTRFKKVIVPEFSCKSCVWYSKEYVSIFDTIAQTVENEGFTCDVPKKIYFSRLGFNKAKQSEFGEENLAAWLLSNGYEPISPEKLTLRQQVYIWNHAKAIACLDGSIPLNLNFCRNRHLRLLVMHKTHLEHLNLELTLLMRPCHVTLLDAYYEPYKKYPTSIGAGPFLLCITEDVQAYSRQHNMTMPFTPDQIKQQRRKGVVQLTWQIIDLKGKLRKLMPGKLLAWIRSLRGR